MRIVCIGGGTGLHTLLRGLKAHFPDAELAAVVTMMDSGGSTGRLRDEFGYLPPGDIRQSLVALSDMPHELRALMQHRFRSGSLEGHVVGNLLLTALKDLSDGDEYAAIEAMERLLRIRGKVYPVTMTDAQLIAHLHDGTQVRGETNIDIPKHDPSLRITSVTLDPPARIFSKTADALRNADLIIIGPGDLYTSIMPNLVVDGMTRALKDAKARGARLTYIVNTMTKHGETNDFKASDFARTVQEALDGAPLDAVIVNTGRISDSQRAAYAWEHAHPVENDLGNGQCDLASATPHAIIVAAELVSHDAFARHQPSKLARAIEEVIRRLGI
jgi:uncharacterized cofD-like protein